MKIYMIGGKARHGKDTVAAFLKKYFEEYGQKVCIMQISSHIKHFAINYFGWDGKEETKPRSLLQKIGTEIVREKMNKPMFFIDRIKEDIEVLDNLFDIAIISDVRLPLEFEEIKKIYPDTKKIHVVRPDLISSLSEEEQKHITETALDNYKDYDYEIINTTIEKLEEDAKKIVKEEL